MDKVPGNVFVLKDCFCAANLKIRTNYVHFQVYTLSVGSSLGFSSGMVETNGVIGENIQPSRY